MTVDEANQLAIRYKNIWRGGPATEELREQFSKMDSDALERVVDRLARTLEHPPTLAQLWHEHDGSRRPDYGWPRPEDTGPPISLADYLARHPDDRATLRP
jgi:uncharacterized protein (DUF2267 family)